MRRQGAPWRHLARSQPVSGDPGDAEFVPGSTQFLGGICAPAACRRAMVRRNLSTLTQKGWSETSKRISGRGHAAVDEPDTPPPTGRRTKIVLATDRQGPGAKVE